MQKTTIRERSCRGAGRKTAISASGSAIFERNLTGNGTFLMKPAGAGNTGTGIVSPGTVTGPVKGHDYTLSFAKYATTGKMQYSVVDVTNRNTPEVAATDYTASEPITFERITFDVNGQPAAGTSSLSNRARTSPSSRRSRSSSTHCARRARARPRAPS